MNRPSKFGDNVFLIDPENSAIRVNVCHFAFEDLLQGCLRVAELYRYQNSSKTRFWVMRDGVTLINNKGCKTLV